MKKIISTLVMLLLLSGGLYATQNDKIEININVPIENENDIIKDITEDITSKLEQLENDSTMRVTIFKQIVDTMQNKIKSDAISVLCNLEKNKIILILKKAYLYGIQADTIQSILENNLTQKNGSVIPLKVSIKKNKPVINNTQSNPTNQNNQETSIIQYEIYAIGAITLIFILIILFKHKSPNAENNEERNKEFKELQSKINIISVDILQLKNDKSTSDSLKNIENKTTKIILEIENIKNNIEIPQKLYKDITDKKTGNKNITERGYIDRTDIIIPPTKRIGYTTEPMINGLEEKKILSESNDFCIYEIEFINEQNARYYINRDPKALKNILSVAYMIPGEYNNQTNNQQATEVKTEEYGIIQKLDGKWYMVKPLKFTIL